MEPSARSPRITHLSWGCVEVEGGRSYKDVKLFPGGAREWDWRESGTDHSPGVTRAAVQELIDHGAAVVVLSQGMNGHLKICPETIQLLEERGIVAHVSRTEKAVQLYNELCETELVAGLFHSTC